MAHYTQTVKYTLDKGYPWERLVIVKDRYTHRVLKPTDCRAFIKTGTLTKFEITSSITTENGILLCLTGDETADLPEGVLEYDVVATIGGVQRPVAKGTIEVIATELVTPLEDAQAMEIRYKQHTDYRRTFTWKDSDGDVLTIQSAFMQAKTTSGTTVVDLRWYSSTPSESVIINLVPASKRGYLAPATGATLEMHISNMNDVAAGTYKYDLFVQDTAGDWDCIVSGALVVEEAVSAPPS